MDEKQKTNLSKFDFDLGILVNDNIGFPSTIVETRNLNDGKRNSLIYSVLIFKGVIIISYLAFALWIMFTIINL